MSNSLPKVTLEQWVVFRAVVEQGSFARAADLLNKSQSNVSYVIAKMEERLPAPALQQVGRKAELTELGKVLYRQALGLLDQAAAIDRLAADFASGWEAEIAVAADALTPMDRLFCALHQFSVSCATTRVRILETTLSGTDEALIERRVQIGLTPHVPPGFLAEPLWGVHMVPVVAAQHAFAKTDRPVTEAQLKRARQIVVRDSGIHREQNTGWLAADQRWTVSHFSSSIAAVKAGLGFAFVPEHKIAVELKTGELVVPKLEIQAERRLTINLVLADRAQAGPAVQALSGELRAVKDGYT